MHDSTSRRRLHPALWLALTGLCAGLPGQSASQKIGTIYKREVDGLIGAIHAAARSDGSLLDGTAITTAKAVTAMGHSHRFYTLGDGPVVRRPITFLFQCRQADGSFADAEGDPIATTAWVRDALLVTDPLEHATELKTTARWLRDQGERGASPWESLLVELGAQMRERGVGPKELGAETARAVATGPVRSEDGAIDVEPTIDGLLQLVACQELARRIDRGLDDDRAFGPVAQRGFDFLLTRQNDGVFFVQTKEGPVPDDGLSALGLAALQTKPRKLRTAAEQEVIEKGLAALLENQHEDGSFGRSTVNYTTCAAMQALAKAEDPRYADALQKARDYVLAIQNIETRGYARGDRDYGSIGYGGDQRGDLSNLGFAVESLTEAGVDANHDALQKAIVFLQRTQNLRSVNDHENRRVKDDDGEWQVVRSGDDGGSAYYPGNSPAGYDELEDGSKIPRSYGSMTYMLLKTYILCGLPREDERVQTAVGWIVRNWTLDENPGSSPLLPDKAKFQGLFYYYMVLAQALDTVGLDEIEVPAADQDVQIDWRQDLAGKLADLQRPDGSWLNEKNGRWWESQPTLCTIYAMLALERCRRS